MSEQQTNTSGLAFIFRLMPIFGAVCVLAGFGWAVKNAHFDAVSYSVVGVGLLLFLTLFLKAEVANLKFYLHLFVYSVMVAGICIVGYLFARQYTKKVDLTEQKLFSLSAGSENYLKRLEKEVSIVITTPDSAGVKWLQDLYASADKLKWEFVNPRKDPLAAKELGDRVREGEVFFRVGNETKKRMTLSELSNNPENVITNSIIEVTRDSKPRLYFLTGHGELPFEKPVARRQNDDAQQPHLGVLRKPLTDRGMETEQLNLAQKGSVPKDAALVAIVAPATDLLKSEAAALDEYLKAGGKLFLVAGLHQEAVQDPLPNLKELMGKYGINVTDNIVLDMASEQNGIGMVNPLITKYDADSPVTRDLQGQLLFVSLAREISKSAEPPTGLEAKELLYSSEISWPEPAAAVLGSGKVTPPDQSSVRNVSLGVAVNKPAPPQMPNMPPAKDDSAGGTRIVALGSNSLAYESLTQRPAIELMLNSVNWLTEQEDQIQVQPRQVEGTPIILTPGQLRLIFAFCTLLLPGALFFGGVSYSMLRRKR